MTAKLFAHADRQTSVVTPDGGRRRVLSYGGGLMLVQFTFDAGVASFEHSHPHEQIGYVVSGEIDVVMEGRAPQRLTSGGSYYVPSNVKHYIRTILPSVLIDAFTPVREDFLG
ncbi:MAG: cupin domain-containing protein [Acidobacteriota bacterium]